MIDVENEKLVSLNAARRLPWLKGRGGNAISLDTINRWRMKGIRRVVLESTRIGGRIFTSEEATLRFLARLNGEEPIEKPSSLRRREIAAADAKLDEAGIH